MLAAVCTLFALGWKRRLVAIALAVAVGGLMVLKPFLRPILSEYGAYSPTSETAMFYLVPGAVLLALGALIVFAIRPQRIRIDLALLKPTILASVGFVAGAALAVWAYTGETNRSLLESRAAELDALRGRYAVIAQALRAEPPPPLPERVEGLDPLPRFVMDDPSSHTDFTTYHNFVRSRTSPTSDEFVYGQLSSIFMMLDEHWSWIDWEYREDLVGRLESALATRYVAVYRCETRDDVGDDVAACTVWLADVPSARVLLRVSSPFVPRYGAYGVEEDVLRTLQYATDETFRRTSD